MIQKPGAKKQAFTPCTLKELCPEDKQKVAQLVKQVVELGKENQQLKAAAATAATTEEKLRQIQDCNKEAVKENCSLKNKLGQAITVLRMYHHKVQGLDAALRALQHSAPADASADTPDQQQAAQQQQDGQEPLPLPAPAAAGQGSPVKQPASAGTEQATASQAHAGSATAASRGPGHGSAPDQITTAVANPAATPMQTSLAGSVQQQQQQCLCSKLLCGGLPGLSAIPSLSAFPSNLNVGLPVQQLQPWQLQGLFAEQLVSNPRTVLHFDPTIGSRGAYLVQELPDQQLPLLPGSTAAASPVAAAALSAGNAPSAPASPGRVLEQQLAPQYQPTGGDSGLAGQSLQQTRREISAGGAATAAAAAAASSALAAVRAAAAVCTATPWQPDLSSCSISSPGQQQGVNMFGGFPDAAQHPTVHSRAASSPDGDPLGMNSCGSAVRASQDAAGLTAAVEEVPIVDMAEAPVHVLVQNEKSASSLHQVHARVTLAGGMMGDGAASPEPPAPAAMAAAAAWAGSSSMVIKQPLVPQQLQQQQQYQQDPGCGDSDSRQAGVWQQPVDQQYFAQLPAHQQQQLHHHSMEAPVQQSYMASSISPANASQQQQHWQQQQQQAYQQVGTWEANKRHAGHVVGAGHPVNAAAPCGDRTNTNWAHGQGASAHGKRSVAPNAAAGGQQHGPEYIPSGQQLYSSGNTWSQQEQQQPWLQQGQQGGVEDGFGTRELLLKFDESLVDILAEVERLEQQQQQARHQPPQQQRIRPRQEQRQPRPQQQLQLGADEVAPARLGAPAAGAGALAQAPPCQQSYLDQKQAQLQQRFKQLQQEDMRFSSGTYPVAQAPGHGLGTRQQLPASAAWGYSRDHGFDADDVSDILNHLD